MVIYGWKGVQNAGPTRWPSKKNYMKYDKWMPLKARTRSGILLLFLCLFVCLFVFGQQGREEKKQDN